MSNGTFSVEQIVENVWNSSPDFRRTMCAKALRAIETPRNNADSLVFYFMAIRAHSADKLPEETRQQLLTYANFLRPNNSQ